jgi:hypothetical protein
MSRILLDPLRSHHFYQAADSTGMSYPAKFVIESYHLHTSRDILLTTHKWKS